MVLAMNRPMKRSGSSFEQFRKRIPLKVLEVARGKRATISLPPEVPDGDPILISITIGAEVRFSLQTRNSTLAKQRNAAATEQLERICKALLDGPRHLTKKRRMEIAGLLYEAFAKHLEDDPGDPEIWQRVHEANDEALTGTPLTIDTFPGEGRQRLLERRFGGLVDLVLQREGIVTDVPSRNSLLAEAGQALNYAAKKLKRNAEGDYTTDPAAARFPKWEGIKPTAPASSSPASLTFDALLMRWENEGGKARSTKQAFRSVVAAFCTHLGHDNPKRATKANVREWKDALLAKGLSAKTINGSYLAHIRTLYRLAKSDDLIDFDPTDGIRVREKKKAGKSRLPYTDDEVATILELADAETKPHLYWGPWLLALTGARVGEITQLWGQHVKKVGDLHVVSITTTDDGGEIKTASSEREVPIHPAIIARGFLDFVATRKGGPLFYGGTSARQRPPKPDAIRHASKGPANRLREWVRSKGFGDHRKAPNHAFRHWFKTKCAKLDISDSIANAIQGHSGSDGEAATYRHIDVQMMAEALGKISVPKKSDT